MIGYRLCYSNDDGKAFHSISGCWVEEEKHARIWASKKRLQAYVGRHYSSVVGSFIVQVIELKLATEIPFDSFEEFDDKL
jgi:hypothetical protein